jgi:hypothetical protein
MLRSYAQVLGRFLRPQLCAFVAGAAAILGCPQSLRAASVLQVSGNSPGLATFAGGFTHRPVNALSTIDALLISLASRPIHGGFTMPLLGDGATPAIAVRAPIDTGFGGAVFAQRSDRQTAQEPSLAAFNLPTDFGTLDLLGAGTLDLEFTTRFGGFDDDSEKINAAIVPLPPGIAMGGMGLIMVMIATIKKRRSHKA